MDVPLSASVDVSLAETSVCRVRILEPGHPENTGLAAGADCVFAWTVAFSCFAFWLASTAASSYAAASLSTNEMAPVGQVGRQSPSPSQ